MNLGKNFGLIFHNNDVSIEKSFSNITNRYSNYLFT